MTLPVHRLPTRVGRSFLLEHRGVLTLVDTGTEMEAGKILRAIRKVDRRPEDVRQIVVTHSHGDHAGAARQLREVCEAPVYAGARDVDTIAGRAPYAMSRAAWGRASYGWLAKYPRFEVDHAVDDRVEIHGGLELIPTPGHTLGHISVWAPDVEALFVGDAVWNIPNVRPSWKAFTQDPDASTESLRRLADLPAETLLFGHGLTVRRGGRDRLRRIATGR